MKIRGILATMYKKHTKNVTIETVSLLVKLCSKFGVTSIKVTDPINNVDISLTLDPAFSPQPHTTRNGLLKAIKPIPAESPIASGYPTETHPELLRELSQMAMDQLMIENPQAWEEEMQKIQDNQVEFSDVHRTNKTN